PIPSPVGPVVDAALRSPGAPLDAATRAFIEPRFGYDFSHVPVHADARAGDSARALGAAAFTVGSHIVFAPGRYQPATSAGRYLLAHEAAHVVQQTRDGAMVGPFVQRMTCQELTMADERPRVDEGLVRDAVLLDMASQLHGPFVPELTIPGGSSQPFRTEPPRRRGPDTIR